MQEEWQDRELPEHAPAALRYLWASSIDDRRIFPIALIGLAVKGYLRINDTGIFHLVKLPPDDQQHGLLSPDERQLLTVLFKGKDDIEVSNRHSKTRTRFDRAKRHVQGTAQQHGDHRYSRDMRQWWIRTLTLTLISFVLTGIIAANLTDRMVPVALGNALLLIGSALIAISISDWKPVFNRASADRSPGVLSVILTLAGLIFGGGGLLLAYLVSPVLMICNVGILATLTIEYQLTPKRTKAGNTLHARMQQLQEVMIGNSAETIPLGTTAGEALRIFEHYLPYAMALDVELAWAARITAHIEVMSSTPAYCPKCFGETGVQDYALDEIVKTVSGRFIDDIELAVQPFAYL